MIHLYEIIKIILLSTICWSFIDSRQTSLKVLETIDQIKAISKTNYEMIMKEDIDLDALLTKNYRDGKQKMGSFQKILKSWYRHCMNKPERGLFE